MLRIVFLINLLFSSNYALSAPTRLIYGETVASSNFDPYTSQEASSQRLTDLVFDGLVQLDADGKYKPSLAKQWFISEDRKSITIILKKDVKWHPEENMSPQFLTSNDVKKTVALVQDPKSKVPNKSLFNSIKEVQIINKQSLKIHFTRAVSDPLRYCLFKVIPAYKFSKNKVLDNNNPFVQKPIGTGKYRFVKLNKTGEILLKKKFLNTLAKNLR